MIVFAHSRISFDVATGRWRDFEIMADIAPTFIRTLITDVIVAREHLSETDEQGRRRNLIRTSFAAIEGLVWLLRNHVLEVGSALGNLAPLEALALQDKGYAVGGDGVLRETAQYMSFKVAIKYAIRRAQAITPELSIDYGGEGWAGLMAAVEVRHRITHPKTTEDLVIEQDDLAATSRGLVWLLATVEYAMQSTNTAFQEHNAAMRSLTAALKRGDPGALRLYNEFLENDTI